MRHHRRRRRAHHRRRPARADVTGLAARGRPGAGDPDLQGDATGAETAGKVNVWTYSASAGPTVDGTELHFVQGTVNWSACGRDNGSSPDSVGIGLKYSYDIGRHWRILRFFGGPGATQLRISDKTVMALNP